LSTGTNFAALHFDFSIGKSTINGIVKETCKILWSVLLEAEMPQPTKETWLQISDLFYKKNQLSELFWCYRWQAHQLQKPKPRRFAVL